MNSSFSALSREISSRSLSLEPDDLADVLDTLETLEDALDDFDLEDAADDAPDEDDDEDDVRWRFLSSSASAV